MSDGRFPLASKLGIEFHMVETLWKREARAQNVVLVEDLECILEKAPVVYTQKAMGCEHKWEPNYYKSDRSKDTHAARLFCIEPIAKPDTAESLLREMLTLEQSVTWRIPAEMIKRVRELVGK